MPVFTLLVAVAAALGLLVLVVFALPPLLVDDGGLKPAELVNAEGAARTALVQAAAGLAVLVGLVFTARTVNLTRHGQVSERFTKAVGQLGDESLDIRSGAIYALEQVAIDSRRYRLTVLEVLQTYVAGRRPEVLPVPGREAGLVERDVQVAMTVIGRRREAWRELDPVKVYALDLPGLRVPRANLKRLNAYHARLDRASFVSSNLESAGFGWVKLRNGFLSGARLRGASFLRADCSNTYFPGADLRKADFSHAILDCADFSGRSGDSRRWRGRYRTAPADLKGANLEGASVVGTNFKGVDLRYVHGLTQAQVDNALVDEWTRLPGHLTAPTDPAVDPGNT